MSKIRIIVFSFVLVCISGLTLCLAQSPNFDSTLHTVDPVDVSISERLKRQFKYASDLSLVFYQDQSTHIDSILYSVDLIDDSKDDLFKRHFDTWVKLIHDYNVNQNREYENYFELLDDPTKRDSTLNVIAQSNSLKYGFQPARNKLPINNIYLRRIMSVLEILYDYDFKGKSFLFSSDNYGPHRPGIYNIEVLPLLRMYLSDAPNIDADWLYDKWVTVVTPQVAEAYTSLYDNERHELDSISRARGYKDKSGHPLTIFLSENDDVVKYFPDSKYVKYLIQSEDYSSVDKIRGSLKHSENKVKAK